jgi:hypothetical protein
MVDTFELVTFPYLGPVIKRLTGYLPIGDRVFRMTPPPPNIRRNPPPANASPQTQSGSGSGSPPPTVIGYALSGQTRDAGARINQVTFDAITSPPQGAIIGPGLPRPEVGRVAIVEMNGIVVAVDSATGSITSSGTEEIPGLDELRELARGARGVSIQQLIEQAAGGAGKAYVTDFVTGDITVVDLSR